MTNAQTPPPAPNNALTTRTKVISILSNLAVLGNVVVGFFASGLGILIQMGVVLAFIGLHAFLRLAFVKAQTALEHAQTAQSGVEKTATSIAPPMVRNIASVITAVILAVVLYFIGFGVGAFLA